MPQASILNWRDGGGWLVLSGGGDFAADELVDIDTEVLSRTISHGALALIWSASDIETADRYLDHLQDLGGRTGYLLDITGESTQAIEEQLEEAGIILLMEGAQSERLLTALKNHQELLEKAHERGATIYAQGALAALLGAWIPSGMGLQQGLGWLNNAIVSTDLASLKTWLETALPTAYGVGLGKGVALALGADGEVEIWGQQSVSVLLGKDIAE